MRSPLPAALMLVFLSAACDKADGTTAPGAPATSAQAVPAGARIVAVAVDEKGFTPSRIEAKRGEKLVLRFTRTSDGTCATKVVFPEAKIERELPLDKPVDVPMPTESAGTLAFQCGMGMFRSEVVIN